MLTAFKELAYCPVGEAEIHIHTYLHIYAYIGTYAYSHIYTHNMYLHI